MTQSKIFHTGTGILFSLTGLALLASLVGWVDSTAIYRLAIPVTLLVSGVSLLDSNQEKRRRMISFGLIAMGVVMLLVRFNVLRGDVINAVLGAVLLGLGVVMLTRLYDSKVTKSA